MSQTAILLSLLQVTIIPSLLSEKKNVKTWSSGQPFTITEFEVETEMQDRLAVVDERVHHLPRLHVPHPHGTVTGPGYDDLLVILQTQDGPGVPREDSLVLLQGLSVPHLDGVVSQSTHNLVIIVLKKR